MRNFGATGPKQGKFERPTWSTDDDEGRDAYQREQDTAAIIAALIATQGSGGGQESDDGPAEGERSPLSYQPQLKRIMRRVRSTQDLSRNNRYAAPVHYSRDFRPMHMYASPAYGRREKPPGSPPGLGRTMAVSGTILAAVVSAGVISWKRNDDLSGGKRFLKAWGSSMIWPFYLGYVGITKLTGE